MVCEVRLALNERHGSTALVVFRYFECSLHSSVIALFRLFAPLSEARDLPILSVTRDLLHGSEKVTRAACGCVKVPVMNGARGVGCIAQPIIVMPRSIRCVRVTRPIVSRHVGQSITSVAMQVVTRMT